MSDHDDLFGDDDDQQSSPPAPNNNNNNNSSSSSSRQSKVAALLGADSDEEDEEVETNTNNSSSHRPQPDKASALLGSSDEEEPVTKSAGRKKVVLEEEEEEEPQLEAEGEAVEAEAEDDLFGDDDDVEEKRNTAESALLDSDEEPKKRKQQEQKKKAPHFRKKSVKKDKKAVSVDKSNELLGNSSSEEGSVKAESDPEDDIFGADEPVEKQKKTKSVKAKGKAEDAKTTKKGDKSTKKEPFIDDGVEKPKLPMFKPKERPPLKEAQLELPFPHQVPSGYDSIFLRLPNFLGIDSKPFSGKEYSQPATKLYTAVIRCKNQDEISNALLSNARLLKWDDGSYQLVVADLVFNAKLSPASNVFVFEQEKGKFTSGTGDGESSKMKSVLECNGKVLQRISIMPTSLHSESHAKMSVALLQQYKKEDKIKLLDFDHLKNPVHTMQELSKREDEDIRKRLKLEKEKQSNDHQQADTKHGWKRNNNRGIDASYVEEEDEYEKDGFITNSDGEGEGEGDGEGDGEEIGSEKEELPSTASNDEEDNRRPAKSKKSASAKRKTSDVEQTNASVDFAEDTGMTVDDDEEEEKIVKQSTKRAKVSKFDSDDEN